VRKDLFPNDVPIAVAQWPKAKFGKILMHFGTSGDGVKDLIFAVSRHGADGGSDTNRASESPSAVAHGAWPPQSKAVGHRRSPHSFDILVYVQVDWKSYVLVHADRLVGPRIFWRCPKLDLSSSTKRRPA
jgi:hypothetical protein